MNEFLKKVIGKFFLYTLLCLVVFGVFTLLACFIAGNFNVFQWDLIGRIFICLFSFPISVSIILCKENII